jgi:ELWxxDGT repeat protein
MSHRHDGSGNGRRAGRSLRFEALESRQLLAADLELVKDINNLPNTAASSNPIQFVSVGSSVFFTATDAVNGSSLWKSDGTQAGTLLVKSIISRPYNSSDIRGLTNVAGTLYFVANDGASGSELWKSDGTSGGTVRVKDISAGAASAFGETLPELINVSGVLYFVANDGLSGRELWKSDGSESGTVRVKDIRTGAIGAVPFSLVDVAGTLYFAANDGPAGHELWKSDGTESGTLRVKDIRPGSGSSLGYLPSVQQSPFMTNVNGSLYFQANDGVTGYELWKSDGTTAGTVRVKEIRSGLNGANIRGLTAVGGVAFFSANDGVTGYEIWKSDGTEIGTARVTNATAALFTQSLLSPTSFQGIFYFGANDGTSGSELWRSDGTQNGTYRVKDIQVGASGSLSSTFSTPKFHATDDRLFFVANDGLNGTELWSTDGTETGTAIVKNINPNGNSLGPIGRASLSIASLENTLFFAAADGQSGFELWKSGGTAATTVMVVDLAMSTLGSGAANSVNVGGMLYFGANDGRNGFELWKSDGTSEGTVLVRDLFVGDSNSSPSSPRSLTEVNGVLYFVALSAGKGYELWKSDGTEAGTVIVKDIFPGSTSPNSSTPRALANIGGVLYFAAYDPLSATQLQLWRSDGTETGTIRLTTDGVGGSSSTSNVISFASVASVTYFAGGSDFPGLWRTDGTVAGTVEVVRLNSIPTDFTEAAGTLYFQEDGHLWKSDGTRTGTIRVRTSVFPRYLTNVGGTLFFRGSNEASGAELWKSDGTAPGTVRVKDIFPGSQGSSVGSLVNANGVLLFQANDGARGLELWRSDGSETGTILVKDIRSGALGISERSTAFTKVGSHFFFQANDGVNGSELWKSDGTESGTFLVGQIYSGFGGSSPRFITQVGDRLFMSANSEDYGDELFSLSIATPPATPGDYNRNGIVDLADFEVWRKDFGSAINLAADGNNDGVIDAADYTYWRTRYDAIRAPLAASPPRRSPFVQPVASATVAVSAVSATQRDLLIASRDAAFAELGEEATVTLKRTRIAASPARRR